MPPILRDATPADAPFLWRMLAEAAHVPADRDVREDAAADPRLAAYVEGWGAAGDRGVIAVDPEPIGAAWARTWTDARFGYVRIDGLPEVAVATTPAARGRGVGTQLMRALMDRSPEGLILSVRDENPAARLYRRLGFVELPEQATTNRAGGRSLVMAWRP